MNKVRRTDTPEIAQKIVDLLFCDGAGNHFTHMSLDNEHRSGWGKGAMKSQIEKIMEDEISRVLKQRNSRRAK